MYVQVQIIMGARDHVSFMTREFRCAGAQMCKSSREQEQQTMERERLKALSYLSFSAWQDKSTNTIEHTVARAWEGGGGEFFNVEAAIIAKFWSYDSVKNKHLEMIGLSFHREHIVHSKHAF